MKDIDWGCLVVTVFAVAMFLWGSFVGFDLAHVSIAQDFCEAQGYTETIEIDDKFYCIDQFGELPTIDAFATMGIVE